MNARHIVGLLLQLVGYALVVSALFLAMLGAARATTIYPSVNGYPASIEYVSGGAKIVDGAGHRFEGRTWDIPSPRTVRATESGGAPLRIGGNDLPLTVRRTIPPSAINRAAAIALKGLAPVAVGLELWNLYDEVRVRPGTCASGGLPSSVSDLLCFDTGVPQEEIDGVYYTSEFRCPGVQFATALEAHNCAVDATIAVNLATCVSTATCTVGLRDAPVLTLSTGSPPSETWLTKWKKQTCNNSTGYCSTGSYINESTAHAPSGGTTLQCPASIDASDPANNIPAGLPPGPDGLCRTGRYNTPKTPVQAADLLEEHAPPTGEQLRDMAQDALDRGVAIEGASEREVSGPASVTGAPKVTTTVNPGGSTTTTTKTPTTNYTYNTNTVNYTTTTVTVVNNAGDVTTTTETEGEVPESDQCKTAPDSLGCSKMGVLPTDEPIWQTRDVVFAPEDLGFNASCPAPETWEVFSMSLTWGYEPICDVAPFIRFALLAFAGIGAISIVIRETNA
jgi:hypothetical protein